MPKLTLLQLPVPPPAFYAATGNVPLASASLAGAILQDYFLKSNLNVEVLEPETTDSLGDTLLIEKIAKESPEFLGISLYLWNSERSLYIAQMVKEKSPNTKVLIGGPEVNADNNFLVNSPVYDFAFSGEAEDRIVEFFTKLLNKEDYTSIHGFANRKGKNVNSFTEQGNINFPLGDYPSPYIKDILKVDPNRSTYVETVRGCRSSCTYCFYPKSSNTLRSLEKADLKKLLINLKEKGARELVFLDPTFNHRPAFEELLDLLIEINSDKQMKMFAEIRPEGMNLHLAQKMAKAGFYRLELGMQSINKETLKRVERYGDPKKVVEVSKILVEEGMDLLLDLIIGLPNDTPKDVLKGVEFFQKHELSDYVQVFPLSILPGTKMRSTASRDGLTYLSTPPYRVIETPTFTSEEMVETLFLAEEILDRRIDETPRVNLINPENFLYGRVFDPSRPETRDNCLKPSGRHFSLWVETEDFSKFSKEILDLVQRKVEYEPYSTLDLIFYSTNLPDLQFLLRVKKIFQEAKPSYLKLALSLRDEDMQHRLCIVLKENSLVPFDIRFEELDLPIFRDVQFSQIQKMTNLQNTQFRLLDKIISQNNFIFLKENFDPEGITFASPILEEKWTLDVLGYGE